MELSGNLFKMETQQHKPVVYYLNMDAQRIHLNDFLGKTIKLQFLHEINCIHCGKKTTKSFFQGYCYPCYTKLPQADQSVIRPELNQAHLGISKDMEWSKQNDLIDHYVYLACSPEIKVGVTRHTQIPTRWIDQGAEYAIKFALTPYRQLAGLIEVELKNHLSDKTNWRKMLSGKMNDVPDLLEIKEELAGYLPDELADYLCDDDEIYAINYPVLEYPLKIKSINLDKTDSFEGILKGIKGQYLILDNNRVFNIRKHNGYLVKLSF